MKWLERDCFAQCQEDYVLRPEDLADLQPSIVQGPCGAVELDGAVVMTVYAGTCPRCGMGVGVYNTGSLTLTETLELERRLGYRPSWI